MSMTDPIADLLTRIRNAQLARKSEVSLGSSRLKQAVVKVRSRAFRGFGNAPRFAASWADAVHLSTGPGRGEGREAFSQARSRLKPAAEGHGYSAVSIGRVGGVDGQDAAAAAEFAKSGGVSRPCAPGHRACCGLGERARRGRLAIARNLDRCEELRQRNFERLRDSEQGRKSSQHTRAVAELIVAGGCLNPKCDRSPRGTVRATCMFWRILAF